MTIYQCNLCFKEFSQKCHLDDHLHKKKKPCNSINVNKNTKIIKTQDKNIQNSSQNSLFPSQNSIINSQNNSQNSQNSLFSSQNSQNSSLNQKNAILEEQYKIIKNTNTSTDDKKSLKKYKCQYCNKLYSRKDSLTRHIGEFCKHKKDFEKVETVKLKNNNTMTIFYERYKNIINDNLKLTELLEEYKQLIKENNLSKNNL